MPSFERYLSKGRATTEQPSFLAPESTEGQQLEKVAKATQTAQDITFKVAKMYDDAQKSQAELNQRTQIQDLLARAEADTDYNSINKYVAENEKIRKESTKTFKDRPQDREASAKATYYKATTDTQLNSIFRKKVIVNEQANTLRFVDMEVASADAGAFDRVKAKLADQQAKGFINAEDAYKLEKRANDDLGMNRINKDLFSAQTPEDIDLIRQDITGGFYEQGGVTIDPEKKRAFLNIADEAQKNLEKKREALEVEAKVKNRLETVVGLASGQINFESLDMVGISEYDPELAKVLTKTKDFMTNYNPKLPANEQPLSSAGLMTTQQVMSMKSYARSVTDVFMQNDNEKLSDFVLRELDKKGDGLTPSVKIAAFANLAALKSRVNNEQNKEDATAKGQLNAIKSGVRFLQASNPYLAPEAIGELIVRNFLSGSSTKEEVMTEAKSILEEKIIDRYAAAAKLPSLPNKIVDGEATVEDLHAGLSDLEGERFAGSYADTDRE